MLRTVHACLDGAYAVGVVLARWEECDRRVLGEHATRRKTTSGVQQRDSDRALAKEYMDVRRRHFSWLDRIEDFLTCQKPETRLPFLKQRVVLGSCTLGGECSPDIIIH
jgi:hypothetical protein